jgi:XTP/dITP diphosphohydrolase/tetrapyrrole methylase family protein/MazG family protein
MERRNPHVFGDAVATDAAEVLRLWNAAKAAEKAAKAEKAEKKAAAPD